MIENFLDLVEQFGFVPNGARIYYLNRSQPPLLTLMVKTYVEYTNDTEILDRALPLLEKELDFWRNNHTLKVTSPWSGKSYYLSRYNVLNNQPRPESFWEDYITANNETYYSHDDTIHLLTPLNASQKGELYAELATGAESGIDYSSRWLRRPLDAVLDTSLPLRSLDIRGIIPVDLNSVLYATEVEIAKFHLSRNNTIAYKKYMAWANQRMNGMYDLMFNEKEFRYFDYNLTSQAQNVIGWTGNATNLSQGVRFYPEQFWPFWLGAIPPSLSDPESVEMVFQPVARILDENIGDIAASNLVSGTFSKTTINNRSTMGRTECLATFIVFFNSGITSTYHCQRNFK
jgi:alpha,alpha-trehalase